MSPATPPDPNRALGRGLRAPRALVVDDEADLRELLELTLVGMGLDVDCAPDLATARRLLGRGRYALCLTDMRLPDGNGLDLVAAIGADHPDTPVAVITAYGSAENAVAALKAGAFDYLTKPVGLDALRTLVRSALRLSQAAAAAGEAAPAGAARDDAPMAAAPREAAPPAGAGAPTAGKGEAAGLLLGVSPAIEAVRASIARLARSMAPVAITGESGSGKELAARLIHRLGSRAAQPFVAVNCGAIPETLMESEFFGHKRGAFTGADQDRTGFFQAADGGTLFLDEVADLPLSMQVKLLRAIQERCVRRVGATAEEPVDVRIVSATHQDLARCVAAGRFRQDLFYRLNVIELRMPPLRERREDVPVLAQAMVARLAVRAGLAVPPRLASVTLRYLQSYAFPGNVRELENVLERALAFSNGEVINVEDLGLRPATAETGIDERAGGDADDAGRFAGLADRGRPGGPSERGAHGHGPGSGLARGDADDAQDADDGDGRAAPARPLAPPAAGAPRGAGARLSPEGIPESLPDYLDAVEREAILRALERTGHNRTAAARRLGVSFRALRYRMQRLGLS
jgi:two-component system response regulator PilR (NtrC family)